jgi:hypothetical protein
MWAPTAVGWRVPTGGIILRNYYAPFLAKRISYAPIREVREVANRWKQRPDCLGPADR